MVDPMGHAPDSIYELATCRYTFLSLLGFEGQAVHTASCHTKFNNYCVTCARNDFYTYPPP